MEQDIIDIIKNLMSGLLTLVGLIFTSLGIILNIKDNWKTKRLRKSNEFTNFITINVWCVVCSILLLPISVIVILFKNNPTVFTISLIIYGIIFLLIIIFLIIIILRYKSLIMLLGDDTKPEMSIKASNYDDDDD